MSKRKTQQQFIEQAKAKHGDRYDYSRVSYTNTRTPVEIICKRCGRHIIVAPQRHLRGDGCKYCSHAKTTEQFIKDAKTKHGDKYSYDKTIYTNNRTKVVVTCPKHGDFLVTPANHLNRMGRGCPQCAIEYRNLCSSKNARKTPEQFAQEARCVHGDKYDYSKVNYKNNNTPVEIVCPEHGPFMMRPSDHLHGCECPSCVHRKRLTTEEFIEKAQAVRPNDHYDFSEAEYVNYATPIKIKCTQCGGYFYAPPARYISGSGCPTCYGSHKLTQEEFVSRARAVHGDKYDYSESDYQGIDTKLKIICPKHGEFWQTPYQHINLKNGCPNCNSSKGELMVMRILENHNINFVHDKACLPCLGDLRPDFYLPDYNLVIEYDGIQHFQPSEGFGGEEAFRETQARDQLKNKLCEENGIKILHIPYTSEDVEKIILEAI